MNDSPQREGVGVGVANRRSRSLGTSQQAHQIPQPWGLREIRHLRSPRLTLDELRVIAPQAERSHEEQAVLHWMLTRPRDVGRPHGLRIAPGIDCLRCGIGQVGSEGGVLMRAGLHQQLRLVGDVVGEGGGRAPDIVAPPAPVGPEAIPDALAGPRPVHCIVIDPGHGGHDTGTIGPGGLSEKDVCLDIARRLRASLRAELPGVEIILTRDGDRFVSLEERTAIANARNADLFISVHANASQSKETSGIETFVLDPNAGKKEGEADAELPKAKRASQIYASVGFGASSRALAGHVQGSLVRGISAKSPKAARDRGIKHASFAVLRGARMPSVLVEVSFVSNPEDENRLRTPAFRQRIASSLTAGVRSYVRTVGRS